MAAYDRLHRAKSLEYLNFVRTRVNTIECTIEGEEKRYGFGWYPLKPKTIGLADYTFLGDNNSWGWNMNEAFIAGVIVHEAFHVYQFESGREPTGMDIEVEAGLYQVKATLAMNHSSIPSITPVEECQDRVLAIYTQLLEQDVPNEVYMDYCGELPPSQTTADAPVVIEEGIIANATEEGLTPISPDWNITDNTILGQETAKSSDAGFNMSSLHRTDINETEYVIIFEVRDRNGTTVFLDLLNVTTDSMDFDLEKTFWRPQQAGDYEIWTFAISGLDSLQVLSPVRTFNYTALPEDIPTDINTKTEGSEERDRQSDRG